MYVCMYTCISVTGLGYPERLISSLGAGACVGWSVSGCSSSFPFPSSSLPLRGSPRWGARPTLDPSWAPWAPWALFLLILSDSKYQKIDRVESPRSFEKKIVVLHHWSFSGSGKVLTPTRPRTNARLSIESHRSVASLTAWRSLPSATRHRRNCPSAPPLHKIGPIRNRQFTYPSCPCRVPVRRTIISLPFAATGLNRKSPLLLAIGLAFAFDLDFPFECFSSNPPPCGVWAGKRYVTLAYAQRSVEGRRARLCGEGSWTTPTLSRPEQAS